MSLKKCLIAFVSSILLLFPRIKLNGCGPFLWDESFRFWLFQPNLVNNDALLPFTYSSNLYFRAGNRGEDGGMVFDSSYEKVNVAEWQTELPSAKTSDIYALLYQTEPNTYFRKMKGDSLRGNSFVQALKNQSDLKAYFDFAKQCEYEFSISQNASGEWLNAGRDSTTIKKLIPKAEALIKSSKSTFVSLRAAYQLIKAYEYLDNTEGVKKTFDAYIKGSKSMSWIIGSALFYYAKAQPEGVARNLWAANCFERTVDKRLQALKLIDINQRQETLVEACDGHQRAVVSTMLALRYPGRALENMQTIYADDPSVLELPMLIEREINKLEDWLFSYKLTNNDTYISRIIRAPKKKNEQGEEYVDDPLDGLDGKYAQIQQINWQSDRAYLDDVIAFVDKLMSENKVKNRPFILLSAAHLAFLKQDLTRTRQHLATLRTQQNVPNNIRVQAELTEVLCDLYATPSNTTAIEEAITRFDATLKKAKNDIADYETFREQIYLFISKKFIADGKIAKGCLLSMMTERHTKDILGYIDENGYHRLYALAKPADFDEALRILATPKTDFEKFLAAEKRPYSLNQDAHYDEKTDKWIVEPQKRAWDLDKIRDYKATYYIRHDQIDSALSVLKTIPRSKWQEEPYQSMLNCNPFYIDLQHPHAATFADSTKYDKVSFLERMISLRNETATNPSVSAQNYYLLGNAYFNMSWRGNFWLMSDITWGTGESYSNYFDDDKAFLDSYFGLERAQKQYELCLKSTNDEKLAALCHFMIGYCVDARAKFQYYQKVNRWDDKTPEPPKTDNPANAVFKNRFPNRLNTYAAVDYWCTNYGNLARVYSGF